MEPKRVIFDTGTSFTYLPASFGQNLMLMMVKNKDYVDLGGAFAGSCNPDDWDSLYLWIQGQAIEIPPESYLVPDMTDDPDQCVMGIIVNRQDIWLLGTSFFRAYYAIHDQDNLKLGLTPHTGSVASISQADEPFEWWESASAN